jgi:DnaK suppressor protein
MDSKLVEQAKEQLLRMRRHLLQEVREARAVCREMGQDGIADIGDMSAATYHRELLMNLSETQQQRIRDIDAALERIAQGVYGECARCGEEIAPRRMEVRPFSRFCIDCKSDIEKFGE